MQCITTTYSLVNLQENCRCSTLFSKAEITCWFWVWTDVVHYCSMWDCEVPKRASCFTRCSAWLELIAVVLLTRVKGKISPPSTRYREIVHTGFIKIPALTCQWGMRAFISINVEKESGRNLHLHFIKLLTYADAAMVMCSVSLAGNDPPYVCLCPWRRGHGADAAGCGSWHQQWGWLSFYCSSFHKDLNFSLMCYRKYCMW